MSSTAPKPLQSRPIEASTQAPIPLKIAEPLRILRVIHTLSRESGGPSESVLRSTAALREQGHYVEVVTSDPIGTSPPARADFPIHPLGGLGDCTLGRWLRANRSRFDCVVVQGLWKSGHTVRCALRATRLPYIVFPHGMLDPVFARLYPLKHCKKQLYWWWREARVLREAAAVCFTSQEECQRARRTFWPYSVTERVVAYGTARPPISPEQQDALKAAVLEKFSALRDRPFILFLGRIHDKKGLSELIEAFAQFRDNATSHKIPAFAIAGPCHSPGFLRALMAKAEALGLPQTNLRDTSNRPDPTRHPALVWLPMLDDTLKWGALLSSEAFILPSHQENFGIAVAEALACGCPVLISDKVNIWHEIAAAQAGFVAADTREGVVELLSRWAATPLETRRTMRDAALRCFETHFEMTRAAASLVETVRETLNR